MRFAALDFETADYGRDSACALSIVRVEDDRIQSTWTHLIRPPRSRFQFTYIHGIGWRHVEFQPTFKDYWPEIRELLQDVNFVAAHNASFDRGVLDACCQQAGAEPPRLKYLCTVRVARGVWNLRPATLPDVCRHLQISLEHHDPTSDATACARIVLAARQQGTDYPQLLARHALRKA
jgi:DNA polymerase-3 subunit epsilon